jgi:hypothetical protein
MGDVQVITPEPGSQLVVGSVTFGPHRAVDTPPPQCAQCAELRRLLAEAQETIRNMERAQVRGDRG